MNKDPAALIDDLWSRIRIVNCVRESSNIVSTIFKSGKPVAVDVEVDGGIVGLALLKPCNLLTFILF